MVSAARRLWWLALLSALPALAQDTVQVENLRFSDTRQKTRLVFTLSAPLGEGDYQVVEQERGFSVLSRALELGDAVFPPPGRKSRWLVSVLPTARGIEVQTRVPVSTAHFLLPPTGPYGHRLVVDMRRRAGGDGDLKAVKRADEAENRKKVIIAIDAGHGGKDPGAVGKRGVFEKDIVLAIAKKIAEELEKEKHFEAVLVRKGDTFLGFRERREKARRAGAHLLLSIHADSFTDVRASGASVYALSLKGATQGRYSALAQHLLGGEKVAPLQGDVNLKQLGKINPYLPKTLAESSLINSLDNALKAGEYIVAELKNVTPMHKKKVATAGFAVLKPTDVPSLLIETGFLSNTRDAVNLARPKYRARLAGAIARGVVRYMENHPPPRTVLAGLSTRRHKVKTGETLWKISRRYRVSVKKLREANGLADNEIHAGQEIIIP